MTARPIRRNAQTPDRNGKIFYTSTTSLSHISKKSGHETAHGGRLTEQAGEQGYENDADERHAAGVVPTCTAISPTRELTVSKSPVRLPMMPSISSSFSQSVSQSVRNPMLYALKTGWTAEGSESYPAR